MSGTTCEKATIERFGVPMRNGRGPQDHDVEMKEIGEDSDVEIEMGESFREESQETGGESDGDDIWHLASYDDICQAPSISKDVIGGGVGWARDAVGAIEGSGVGRGREAVMSFPLQHRRAGSAVWVSEVTNLPIL